MSLSMGIVGLPNVGKSTLFNALTEAEIQAENFPFCTIEPNTGIIAVPDVRLEALSALSGSQKCIPTSIEFCDIAGLVAGASKGEGLGNKFLSHIRQVTAIVHMLRCFEDDNITHVDGKVDPISDLDIIESELILSDLEQAEKAIQNLQKKAKNNDEAKKQLESLMSLKAPLESGLPLNKSPLLEEHLETAKLFQFLSAKPAIYVCNVSESDLETGNKWVEQVAKKTKTDPIIICAELESQLASLSKEEKKDYLNSLSISHTGLEKLAKASYQTLGLQSYLTTGPKETRAWAIPKGCKAPQAAGVIHSDFETGFIRANVVDYTVFMAEKGWQGAKDAGKCRQEGKEYVMQEGDVVEFLFNV